MRKLFNLKMMEDTVVAKHLSEFNMVVVQLSSVNVEIEDEMKALILLSSLPESWSGTVTAVSASAGKKVIKFDDVRDLIISEEIRRRETSLQSGMAMRVSYKGKRRNIRC